MPRTERMQSSTGIYHIMLRGVNLQNIFVEDADNLRFIDTLARYRDSLLYEVYAYCLMGNHVHLLMSEGNEDLGNTMKRIGVSYVYWYNWQYSRRGHLFQGRFKSEPVENDAYFLTVLRYIHQNPLKARLTDDVEKYRWSSYREYTDRPRLINADFALKMFAEDRDTALERFRRFHAEQNDDQCLDVSQDRKTVSDKEARRLVQQKFDIELVQLINMEPDIQTKVLRYLKEVDGVSLRQISRLTGFTVHRVYTA